jgi:hypothetical protein
MLTNASETCNPHIEDPATIFDVEPGAVFRLIDLEDRRSDTLRYMAILSGVKFDSEGFPRVKVEIGMRFPDNQQSFIRGERYLSDLGIIPLWSFNHSAGLFWNRRWATQRSGSPYEE